MRNKIIFTTLTICFFLFNISYSEIIKFESPTINIENDGKDLALEEIAAELKRQAKKC